MNNKNIKGKERRIALVGLGFSLLTIIAGILYIGIILAICSLIMLPEVKKPKWVENTAYFIFYGLGGISLFIGI